MSFHTNPFSSVGYDLQSLKNEIGRKADSHEIASIRSDVNSAERDMRALTEAVHARCRRCDWLEQAVRELNPGLSL